MSRTIKAVERHMIPQAKVLPVRLQREMHDALRAQHPDWILPNGDCLTCDSYDARFTELLIVSLATERALAHRPNNLNLANTTKLPTFFVSNVGSRGHHPLATLGDPRQSQHACGICSARKDSLSRNGLGDPKVLS